MRKAEGSGVVVVFGRRFSIMLLLLNACSSPRTEDVHAFHQYEEEGAAISETTGGPKYKDELFTYEQILTLRPPASGRVCAIT
jgi:hypothetical protein